MATKNAWPMQSSHYAKFASCVKPITGYGFSPQRRSGMARRVVGILGGMGPLATVDFMRKVVEATPAHRDQDHVPMIVHAVPQIPDRSEAILTGTDEPWPALLAGLRLLEQAGAEAIAMPCNTAHAWFDRLAAATDLPFLHIAEAVRARIDDQGTPPARVALMATRGTLAAGIYQRVLGPRLVVPDAGVQEEISAAVAAVKSGAMRCAREFAGAAAQKLTDQGCETLLLACTELPLAFEATAFQPRALDATLCLAEACVAFSLGPAAAQEAA
jgi:aspartate racemase